MQPSDAPYTNKLSKSINNDCALVKKFDLIAVPPSRFIFLVLGGKKFPLGGKKCRLVNMLNEALLFSENRVILGSAVLSQYKRALQRSAIRSV